MLKLRQGTGRLVPIPLIFINPEEENMILDFGLIKAGTK